MLPMDHVGVGGARMAPFEQQELGASDVGCLHLIVVLQNELLKHHQILSCRFGINHVIQNQQALKIR